MTTPLEDHLAAGMREATADYHVDRDLVAGAREHHRRRTTHRRIALSAATAAVVAIVGLGYTAVDGSSTDRLTTASPVDKPLDHTLRTKGPYILHITTRTWGPTGKQTHEKWYDPVTDDHVDVNGGGQGIDVGYNLRKSMRGVCVDRNKHTWWTCAPEEHSIPLATPDNMRAWLKTVKLTPVGNERINGVDTIHLRRPDPTDKKLDVWVTADSDVLVRMVSHAEVPDVGTVTMQTDYAWFDRTPEARAKVVLTPPAGWPSQEPTN
ncbi:hypothetical protein [Cryptosporangium sp. NPDC048952]|uniref:hypothetical protein n=1 Tax=Cryptosporangium sp. NPDC048952 TaxID=3363961 RepID=UPI003718F191